MKKKKIISDEEILSEESESLYNDEEILEEEGLLDGDEDEVEELSRED